LSSRQISITLSLALPAKNILVKKALYNFSKKNRTTSDHISRFSENLLLKALFFARSYKELVEIYVNFKKLIKIKKRKKNYLLLNATATSATNNTITTATPAPSNITYSFESKNDCCVTLALGAFVVTSPVFVFGG